MCVKHIKHNVTQSIETLPNTRGHVNFPFPFQDLFILWDFIIQWRKQRLTKMK